MIRSIETTGKTKELAIRAALEQLKLTEDDITYEILELGRSGFLGIGAVPARVRVSYDDGPERAKPVKTQPVKAPAKKPETRPKERAEEGRAASVRRREPGKGSRELPPRSARAHGRGMHHRHFRTRRRRAGSPSSTAPIWAP